MEQVGTGAVPYGKGYIDRPQTRKASTDPESVHRPGKRPQTVPLLRHFPSLSHTGTARYRDM